MKTLSLDDAIKAVTMLLDCEDDTDLIWSCDVINNLKHAPSLADVEPTAVANNIVSVEVHFDGWVSVKEKAPEVGKVYIVYAAGRVGVGRYIAKDNWLIGSFFPQPTHWMELPEFPEEAGR